MTLPIYMEKNISIDIIAQTETDGRTYFGCSAEIGGQTHLVYPDCFTVPEILRALADEIENPQ